MRNEVVVVVRNGVVDRVFCSNPETVVTVINFGIGDEHAYAGLSQYKFPEQEWDWAEIAEICDEYNASCAHKTPHEVRIGEEG